MVFSHCWVGSPGWLCLPATTSFEFLIRKPPCNYWINVNYESWLGLRHRYRYRRTRVKLSLFLSPCIYIYIYLTSLYPSLTPSNCIFRPFSTRSPTLPPFPFNSHLFYLCLIVCLSLFIRFNPLSFLLHLLCLCVRLSFTTTLLQPLPSTPFLRQSRRLPLYLAVSLARQGLGIIKIRWLICKFNKITVLGMPGADKRLYRVCLYRGCGRCSVWLSLGGGELDGRISCWASFDPVEVVASRKQGTIVLLLDSLVRCSFEDYWRLVSS